MTVAVSRSLAGSVAALTFTEELAWLTAAGTTFTLTSPGVEKSRVLEEPTKAEPWTVNVPLVVMLPEVCLIKV